MADGIGEMLMVDNKTCGTYDVCDLAENKSIKVINNNEMSAMVLTILF